MRASEAYQLTLNSINKTKADSSYYQAIIDSIKNRASKGQFRTTIHLSESEKYLTMVMDWLEYDGYSVKASSDGTSILVEWNY